MQTNPAATPGTTKTKRMVTIALITAVICILAPLSIPIPVSPVPITLTNLVIFLGIYLLDWKDATLSVVIYLALGIVGLPVFSGFSGGPGKLAGPTGGYLIGFLFLAVITGYFVTRFQGKLLFSCIGMVLGMAVTYIFGTAWLAHQLDLSFTAALAIGVIPYLAGDAVKMVVALIFGPVIRKRLLPFLQN